jgi:hypothetical protein
MDSGPEAVAIAITFASAIAIAAAMLVYRFGGASVLNWVRRVFLILVNLSPGAIGTWRRSFTRREASFAAGFLVFIITLMLLLLR